MIEFITNLFLLPMAVAAFSIQVAISSLADKVKKLFYLDGRLLALSNINSWTKIFPKNWIALSPFILILVLLFKIHRFITELVSCPYCVSVWLMFLTYYFYCGYGLVDSIMFTPIVLFHVAVQDKIMVS